MSKIKLESDMFKELQSMSLFVDFHRIETGETEVGVPDVFYHSSVCSAQGWIELKIAKFVSGRIKIPYRPGQQYWLRRYSLDRNAFTLIYYRDRFILTKNFDMYFKNYVRLIESSRYTGKHVNTELFLSSIGVNYEKSTDPNSP